VPRETLSTELPYATVQENTADDPTPVVVWDIEDGTELMIEEGAPLIADFAKKSDGSDPSRATRVGFAYREPNDPLGAYTVINDFSVSPFNTLTLREQQSGDNAQRRRVSFTQDRIPSGALVLEDTDQLALFVNSPDVLDAEATYINYPISVRNV
jgi:hypothetical protein